MSVRLKTSIIVVGGVILLAAAAFVGLSLVNRTLAGQTNLTAAGAAKNSGATVRVIPATEIPATDPDVVGILQTLQNTSLTVQPDGQAPAAPVEVVVTTQTRLYRDATMDQYVPITDGSLQMVVAPYSLDQVVVGDRIVAWGDRRSDRLVADVIVVRVRHADATPTP